jgi:hypothetical protein
VTSALVSNGADQVLSFKGGETVEKTCVPVLLAGVAKHIAVTGGESIRVIRKSRVFALLCKDSILCDRETAVYLLPTIMRATGSPAWIITRLKSSRW